VCCRIVHIERPDGTESSHDINLTSSGLSAPTGRRLSIAAEELLLGLKQAIRAMNNTPSFDTRIVDDSHSAPHYQQLQTAPGPRKHRSPCRPAGEMFAGRAADGVDGLPRDEHGHDGGLARSGGEFERETHQRGIGVFVRGCKVFEQALAGSGMRATSVSQMAVSTASIWQKKDRALANW